MTLKRAATAAGLTLALALAAAPAHALFGDDEARKAILDLRSRVDAQIRRIDEMNARLDRIEQTSRGQLQLQGEIDGLKQEIARLRGQIEVQSNELSQTQRRQKDMFTDVDGRLRRFEPVGVNIDGQNVTVDQTERRTYEAALAQFRAGDFRESVNAFQAFQRSYPDSAYSANVLFWIGSGHFALKDYKSAITTHSTLLAKHPDSPRAPDAMLNMGLAQAEGGDRRAARKTLEDVVAKYPDAAATQMAKDRLAALK